MAPGSPRKLYDLTDLTRPDVRFIGRQSGSGTRRLLEWLLDAQGLASERIAGFEQGEFTHAAVAAYVASGMAEAGFGLETPARRFGLDFVPLASERYFLLCRAEALALPAVQTVVALLRSEAFAPRWMRCRVTTPRTPATCSLGGRCWAGERAFGPTPVGHKGANTSFPRRLRYRSRCV